MLEGKTIVLGVTGSIAAYKAVDIASQLTKAGATVNVVMTKAAREFVTPFTFRTITHRPVITEMFDIDSEDSVEHVALAEKADAVLIAPATATTIARLAIGSAEDMLSAIVLATRAPVVLAPAMNVNMYEAAVTRQNLKALKDRGFTIVEPDYGRLASGAMGRGRLPDLAVILGTLRQTMGRNGDLAGRKVVVSAGGTHEAIDPVRVITNRSSGKMGYAIAEAARDRGADVVLVTAPTHLPKPVGIVVAPVMTTMEMRDAILAAVSGADALIMAAAPADFRVRQAAGQKIKKEKGSDSLILELVKNPDILAEAQGDFVKVGFAAESEDLVANAREKLAGKNCDLFVANDITAADAGFAVDTNRVVLIERNGAMTHVPLLLKAQVAERILDKVVELLAKRRPLVV
ncbi:MAG: bifunctional phosphopantothenoylcysteine decarboxylase/phosphopantothenate--cysteine ligase CoaBC [Dehalococcoidia bacterium]|nr:bifunctional phosphopantothenoylcysteine decarboxylase/phosphopantothenate--cysteine ligase CoaBC [Dehalococcoidia bacterium]